MRCRSRCHTVFILPPPSLLPQRLDVLSFASSPASAAGVACCFVSRSVTQPSPLCVCVCVCVCACVCARALASSCGELTLYSVCAPVLKILASPTLSGCVLFCAYELYPAERRQVLWWWWCVICVFSAVKNRVCIFIYPEITA